MSKQNKRSVCSPKGRERTWTLDAHMLYSRALFQQWNNLRNPIAGTCRQTNPEAIRMG